MLKTRLCELCAKTCELGCTWDDDINQRVQAELSFLEGALEDIEKLKNNENYIIGTRLQCPDFTGRTIQKRKEEELALMRFMIKTSGMEASMQCSCSGNKETVDKIILLYSDELSLEALLYNIEYIESQ